MQRLKGRQARGHSSTARAARTCTGALLPHVAILLAVQLTGHLAGALLQLLTLAQAPVMGPHAAQHLLACQSADTRGDQWWRLRAHVQVGPQPQGLQAEAVPCDSRRWGVRAVVCRVAHNRKGSRTRLSLVTDQESDSQEAASPRSFLPSFLHGHSTQSPRARARSAVTTQVEPLIFTGVPACCAAAGPPALRLPCPATAVTQEPKPP